MNRTLALVAVVLVGCHHREIREDHHFEESHVGMAVANTDPLGAKIDDLAHKAVDETQTVAVSVAIGNHGKIVWAKGYGFADILGQKAADAETVYRIGSITKQFTAAAIVQLAEAGKLALTDDVAKYVPGLARPVTIEQLLHHTSGMPSYTDQEGFEKLVAKPMTPAQIVALVKDVPWDFPPGTKWNYSNTGYVVLGMVIEKASGEPYAQYLANHVFAPAGLTQTSYCDETRPDAHRAIGYSIGEDKKPVVAQPIDMSVPFSAGAICSTAIDLVRWAEALRTGRVVSPAGYAKMTTSHGLADMTPYGFGLMVGDVKGHRTVFHNGGINGFVSELHDYPDDGITIAVLTNAESAASKVVERGIATAELALPSDIVAISAADLPQYAGTYEVPGLGDVVIAVDGDHLTVHPAKQPTFPLEYHGKDVFFLDAVAATITFERDGATVSGLTIKQAGHDVEGKRK